ncbi:MAG: hypothetical protein GTO42_01190 [Candidatus Latescibacteria bacterium]|nr:hypothetical protein [Candidatus Latescibacterota bacterium]NIO27144.1 hypothetical protein [Candidatus Latescibacterota bacterium]NIO54668.1 hypothetical protein [Candidatus Latescibacterota bacterium]NIT00751.1 hypothetical protein [Candidatus Latescibacterota bacterium]NIT37674.1 hypothetical protein [Candidatus Latescibacterota bacterium]
MAVKKPMTIPEGLEIRKIPRAKYAVFTCLLQAIGDMYRYIFEEWFSTSGYELDSSVPTFEKYPPAEDASSVVLIHIPIRKTESR